MTINKIPKTENGNPHWIKTEKGNYLITHNLEKEKFTLWKIVDKNKFDKISSASSPLTLKEKIIQIEKSL